MNIKTIVPAIATVVLLSTPVLAAADHEPVQKHLGRPPPFATSMAQNDRCTRLERQFDAAFNTHGKAVNASEATIMRDEGGKLCANGEHFDGIAKLEQALKDLGVKAQG